MHSDTHRLTRASLELSSSDARKRRTAMGVTILVMLLLAGGGAYYLHESGTSLFATTTTTVALRTENAGLRTQLERLHIEFEMEKATRAELDRQAGKLHAQINDLTNRLEFLAARDTRANQTR